LFHFSAIRIKNVTSKPKEGNTSQQAIEVSDDVTPTIPTTTTTTTTTTPAAADISIPKVIN
jgi:hypothetical protein